jgi:hypothetical protein
MLSVIYQIDQHDFAVKNRHTLDEMPYDLDIPSWDERASAVPAAGPGLGLPLLTAPLN